MARTQRDRLSFAAMVAGGACVVLVAAVLIAVLRSPAVPRPRGLITVVEQVAPETIHPPQDSRDDARIPSAAEPAPPPQARVASAPPPAPDSAAATPAPATPPVVEVSTLPLKSSTSGPGNSTANTQGQRGLVILQIGDSHTAADYFTAELRQKLQARYGNGGVGYLDAGKPHIGVRSGAMKIAASAGWTYHAIQRSDNT